MFKWFCWWRIRNAYRVFRKELRIRKALRIGNKKLLARIERERAKDAQRAKYEARYTRKRIIDWLKNNEFGLTEDMLNTHCISEIPKHGPRNINKTILGN